MRISEIEAIPEVIPPCPTRPPPIPTCFTPEQEAERKHFVDLQKRVLEFKQEKESKAKAKPPPPICPLLQEDQGGTTVRRIEPKATAPPPSLQDDEEREAERKRISLQFLTNLNQATKAQREARVRVKAPPPALQGQQRPEPPKYELPLPSKKDRFTK